MDRQKRTQALEAENADLLIQRDAAYDQVALLSLQVQDLHTQCESLGWQVATLRANSEVPAESLALPKQSKAHTDEVLGFHTSGFSARCSLCSAVVSANTRQEWSESLATHWSLCHKSSAEE